MDIADWPDNSYINSKVGEPTEDVEDTPVTFINSTEPTVISPILVVADTPVIGSVLTPKAKPAVPKAEVEATPVIG